MVKRTLPQGSAIFSMSIALVIVSTLPGCTVEESERPQSDSEPTREIDRLIEQAKTAMDDIIRRSPEPEKWGDLRLVEYDADYQFSGLPAFKFIDRNTVKIEKPGEVSYTDLEFVLKDAEAVYIQSHFSGLLTGRAENDDFKKTVGEFAEFREAMSFYVTRAKEDILASKADQLPEGEAGLKLARIRFEYFDRPQAITLVFEQLSTLERSGTSRSVQTIRRRLDPRGTVVHE